MECCSWTSVVLLLFLISNTVQGERRDQERLMTIESEDGEVIHCVDIYKQPAFDNPLLQNHTIEMTPSFNPFQNHSSSQEETTQLWHKNGSCPEGTVPIRSTRNGDHSAFMSLTQFLDFDYTQRPRIRGEGDRFGLELAGFTTIAKDGPFTAIKGRFSVPTPRVIPGESSGAFIVVRRGVDMAFLGWAVMGPPPSKNGRRPPPRESHLPRLYIISAGGRPAHCPSRGYGRCSHFVQTSTRLEHGSVLGTQGEPLPVFQIYKDGEKWWARCGNETLGYWPTSLFGDLETAEVVGWSGFVYNSAPGGRHTTTEMGNGRKPEDGNDVAFIDDMSFVQQSTGSEVNRRQRVNLEKVVGFPGCYSATLVGASYGNRNPNNVGLTMYYGGKGEPGCDDVPVRQPQPQPHPIRRVRF